MSAPLSGYNKIDFKRDGRILRVSINSPETRNAVDDELHHELSRVFYDVNDDPDSDIVILSGTGKFFCAGGDMGWFQGMIDDPARWRAILAPAKRITTSLLELEKPVICRLNGAAAGLGASLALLCDIVVAADNVLIGDPHVKMGLVAADGGTFLWPQLVGYHRAKEILLTGRMLTAGQAQEMGLFNYVVPADRLDEKVDELAAELAAGSQLAIRWTKSATNLELRRHALAVTEAGVAYETINQQQHDHQEAVNAFKARRAPEFRSK